MSPSWLERFWRNATGHPPSEPHKVEPEDQGHPDSDCRLHAVVIGINEYVHQKKLKGAVPDADAFYGYLTGDLSVPKINIKRVTNSEATREGIINALLGLSKNDNIQEGDPIVIYYSGHGGEIPAPVERAQNGAMIQCLLPVDTGTDETKGESPIPDYVIGALLEEIANKKGNNITVIFDCCHSAGGSRDDKEPAGARYVSSDRIRPLPPNLDDDLKLQLSTSIEPKGFIGQAMASHVLIAACSHSEKAWENGLLKRGYFTLALLQRLRAANIDSLTYEGLLKRVPTLDSPEPQRPVCEGKHINRVLFDAKVSSSNNVFIPVVPGTSSKSTAEVQSSGTAPLETPSAANQKYYLHAGAAQGISPGSIFTLHTTNFLGTDNTLPGKVKIGDVGPFRALLEPVDGETVDMSQASYARQVGYGKQEALGVFFTEEFVDTITPNPNWEKAFASAADSFVLHPVDEPLAHLTVRLTEDKKRATFKIREQAVMKYGVDTLPHTVELKAESVVNVLRAIARWNWHLRRTPVNRPFESDVTLEFLKLKQSSTPEKWGEYPMVPGSGNLNIGGEARIVVDSLGHYYGLRITNNSGRDLYAYTTYFSVRDQSIKLLYNKVASNESGFVDPSLPKADPSLGPANTGNVLTIGYGSSGVAPIRHYMADDGTDIGIYKVFLSTESADFDTLQQDSPFSDPSRDMDRSREGLPAPDLPYWDTLTFAVVQSRNPFPDTGSCEQGMLSSESLPLLKQESDGAGTVACQKGKEKDFDWFKTDPLTAGILNRATAMQLRTFSREERSIRPGVEGKTEFHICILDDEEFPKCGEDGQPLVWVSHSNEPGPNLLPLDGKVFTRDQPIWDHVQPGDAFLVMSYVRGLGWKNIAEQGSLRIW